MGQVLSLATRHLRLDDHGPSLVALPAKPELLRARQRAAIDAQGNERRPRSREEVATVHHRTVTASAQSSSQPATDTTPVETSAQEDSSKLSLADLLALILEDKREREAGKEEWQRARQEDKAAAERVRQRDQVEANGLQEKDRAEFDELLSDVKHQLEQIHRKLERTVKVEDLSIWGNIYARFDRPVEHAPDSVIRNAVVLAAADKSVKADGEQIFLAFDEA